MKKMFLNDRHSNIILIGMPAVGKSTVGVILAKETGYSFLDSDLLIQQQEGRLLKTIIAEEGVDGFLRIENQVNRDIRASRSVIATGGSAVYGEEAMAHFKEIGRIIYLHCSYETLAKRLNDLHGRGVVLREGQTLYDIYEERRILYERYADLMISQDSPGEIGIEDTLQMILARIVIQG